MTTFKNTQSSAIGKFFNWIHKERFRVLLVLTLLMILVASRCNIPGLIDQPQFTTPIQGDWVKEQLGSMLWAYYGFFIIDFIWALLLLWVIYSFVKNEYLERREVYKKDWKIKAGFILYSIIVAGAYILDCIENSIYVSAFCYPELIKDIKTGLYAVVILIYLILIIRKYFHKYNKTILSFVKSSVYSLLIIIIIGVLLPTATQVNSIVVNLYDHPYNLFILLVVSSPIYSVMLAHYPSYFNIDEKFRKWYRAACHWGLVSTVFYRRNKEHKGDSDGVIESHLNFLFRILGILFYVALFYFIAFTSETNFKWETSTSALAIALLVIGIHILYTLTIKKNRWLDTNFDFLQKRIPFSDGDYNLKNSDKESEEDKAEEDEAEEDCNEEKLSPLEANKKEADERLLENETRLKKAKSAIPVPFKEDLQSILPCIRWYLWILTVAIFFHIFLFGYFGYAYSKGCSECFYSHIPVILSLVCIVLQMITYIYYRTFRSVLKFVFFSKENDVVINAFYIMRVIKVQPDKEVQLTQKHIDLKKSQLLAFFKQEPFGIPTGIIKFYSGINNGIARIKFFSFGSLSNDVLFLQFTILFGFINTLFFLWINIDDGFSLHFNAALIILSALFLYYGILVVLTKNYIFYKYSKERYAIKNFKNFRFYLVMGFFVLFLSNRLGRIFPNELFTLNSVSRVTNDELDLDRYVKELPENQTRYYIGAYGGGMKSNAWTLSVLNEFYKNDPQFLEKAVVISGASGGTMGLINWSAIRKNNPSNSDAEDMITKISTEHVLSLDLTHILGRDTFNHLFVPGILCINLSGYDRSTLAMQRYAELSGNTEKAVDLTPYRKYWKEMYQKHNNRFPVLIANTTNVLGNQGMAVSIRTDQYPTEHSLLYQGADNILELQNPVYEKDSLIDITETTLPYYNAASTSNRFPLISPAAKIETLGHFNDGGIYENSGLLSAYKLFRSINSYESISDLDNLKQRNVFINIVNDKNLYIRKVVKDWIQKELIVNKINKNTEISAILNSIASTEMMPIFVKKELERLDKHHEKIDFETVYLPHTFTMNDIKNIYGEEFELGDGKNDTYKTLYECVLNNDKAIRSLLSSKCDKGFDRIIEPPMSRVLANDAFGFMRFMLSEESDAHQKIQEISSIK